MRSASLLMLVACTASQRPVETPRETPITVPTTQEDTPVRAPEVTESQALYAVAVETRPATKPARTYALPEETVSALAREHVRGQVLVAGPLFPSEAAARKMVSSIDTPQPVALRVVKDRGSVVQVTTAAVADCVEGFPHSYELTVFVPRASLVARTATAVAKSFDDGTAYAIDRGAPVKITGSQVAWFDPALDQTAAAPPERLVYGLPKYTPAAIPPAPSERLVCDGKPMTKAEWAARKQGDNELDAQKRRDAARRVADARAAKRAEVMPKYAVASAKSDALDNLVDLALVDGSSSSSKINDARKDVPYCGVASPAKSAAAKLGGTAYAWNDLRDNQRVYRGDRGYLADVGASCGRVRVTVDAKAVGLVAGGNAAKAGGAKQKVWIPKPGPVFWPDGKKAGKYTGRGERYLRVSERDTMICVDVRGVADEVCHRRSDVTVEK